MSAALLRTFKDLIFFYYLRHYYINDHKCFEIKSKFAAAFSRSRFQYPAFEYSIKLTYRVSFISFYRLCDLFRFENDSE